MQAKLTGVAVAVAGALTMLSAFVPPRRTGSELTWLLVPAAWAHLAAGSMALTGMVLIVLGEGVAGRRRVALDITILMLLLATVAHVVKGFDLFAVLVTGGFAAILVSWRGVFDVRPGPVPTRGVLRLAGALLLIDICYGLVGFLSHPRSVSPHLTAVLLAREIGALLVGMEGPISVSGWLGRWFPASLTAAGAITVVAPLLLALAPAALRGGSAGDERSHARALVARADADTLDPFVLRRDKRLVFPPGRRAAIGFRYVDGVGLASGDEAVIDVAEFTLTGSRMRDVRQAVSHTRNTSVTTEIIREGDVAEPLRSALLDVAVQGRGDHPEFGFSMALGDFLTGEYPDCLLVVCNDSSGCPVAFQRYLPYGCGQGLSLDLMRRRPLAPNGVNERMIVDMVAWARDHRIRHLSLNFAAFRSTLDPDTPHSRAQKGEAWLIHKADGRFGLQLDTLRRFNAKFAPRWVPRYLVYRSYSDVFAVGVAALAAEGFLPFDKGRMEGLAGSQARVAHLASAGSREAAHEIGPQGFNRHVPHGAI